MRNYYSVSLMIVLLGWPQFSLAEIKTPVRIETIARGLENPWALAFLPDGRMLVTERPGRMRVIAKDGTLSAPLANVPDVLDKGQGGLLDVALSPDFKTDRLIYFSYAEPAEDKAGTAVARAKLAETTLENVEVIFRQKPKVTGGNHFGSRLAFAADGNLFIGLGERFDYSEKAQTLDNHLGKVIRIRPDGSVPVDNPFVGRKEALPEIWSYGHRNIQGAAIHPQSGQLWIHEHGPRGGDEINIPQAKKNYGWPEACYGSQYSFIPIPDDHKGQGFEEPVHYWDPSIAPSGMLFYRGETYPQWKGNLFIGSLKETYLARLELDGEKVVREEKLLGDLDVRIREVEQGPDGAIYVLTDADDGQVVRVVPKK